MNDLQTLPGEKDVLRAGGLAGILGGLVFILVFVIVIAFVGEGPAEPAGWIMRFPAIRAVRTIENGLYLVVLVLWVTHFLALYRALWRDSLAFALFGSVLGILGLVVLAAGALPHVATAPLSDLYHAPGAAPADQATLVLLWQAIQGIFDALLIVGLCILPIGLIALGVAMLGSPAFGKGLGRLTVALGAAGLAAAGVLLVDPQSPIAIVGFLALIIFHLVAGWKLFSLSRVASGALRLGEARAHGKRALTDHAWDQYHGR